MKLGWFSELLLAFRCVNVEVRLSVRKKTVFQKIDVKLNDPLLSPNDLWQRIG